MNYIYCITNTINSKRYVGKTTLTLEERFRKHCSDSIKDRCSKRPLYDAMNKYGIENFIIEELEQVEDESKLDEREIYWIQELQTYGRNGYNATKGGDGKILYDYKEIVELARLGYTSSQISIKVGCCIDTIYKVLKANDVRLRPNNVKIIAQYDLKGNLIQTFWGAKEALKYLQDCNLTESSKASTSIIKCCNGKLKSAFGYTWKYIELP